VLFLNQEWIKQEAALYQSLGDKSCPDKDEIERSFTVKTA
jgi:hypothetical protein